MRFCPFCSAENADEQAVCTACGRRLPPLPPRRRNAPPTGVQLPPRAPVRRSGTSNPPPIAAPEATMQEASAFQSGPTVVSAPPITESGAMAPQPSGPTVISPPPVMPAGSSTSSALPRPSTTGTLPRSIATGALPAQTTPAGRAGSTTKPPPVAPARPASTTNPPPMGTRPPSPPVRAGSTTNPPPLATRPPSPRAGSTTNPPPIPRAGSPTNPPPMRPAPERDDPMVRAGERADPTVRGGADPRAVSGLLPLPQPGVMVSPGAQHARPGSHAELGPPPMRDSAPALPPPPDDAQKRSLLSAISPGPAAQRRDVPPPGERDPRARRVSDQWTMDEPTARPKTPSAPPPLPGPRPSNIVPQSAFGDDFNTMEAEAYDISSSRTALPGETPPPTRIHRPEQHADRPFQPPKVHPIPEKPEPGLYKSARYALIFIRARYQRRGAIKTLQAEINADTDALDQVLGALGKTARQQRVDSKVFSAENTAINNAEERIGVLAKEHADVDGRKAEENSRFADIERERNTKLGEAERLVDESSKELANLEGQRKALRDKRKELERRQKAYLKAAEDNDKQAGSQSTGGESRGELRRAAEQMRKEAAALEPDRQEVDRRISALERPIGESTAKLDAAKAELDAAKRSLSDAREGHTHRLAELEAEQKRKSREISQAEGEISRRLVTLGTLVNLNRIENPAFSELYQRIDRLRGAITARTTEIEKLTAEREAYDRGTMVRGLSAIGGTVVALIALIVILRAIF